MTDVPRAAEFRCDVPTEERLAELVKAPLPLGLVLRSQHRDFVRDVYLDTADNALALRNIVCRVRYGADDRRTLTVSLAEPGVPGAGPTQVFDADVAAIELPAILASDTPPARRLRGSGATRFSHEHCFLRRTRATDSSLWQSGRCRTCSTRLSRALHDL